LRRQHFETLRPICPHCRFERNLEHPLQLTSIFREVKDIILEGVLNCSDVACQLEYPIIDGIPILVPNVRAYITDNLPHLIERDDLSETLESIVGDGAGPGTLYNNTRQHLSTYGWDGYGDLDPDESEASGPQAKIVPGAVKRCLEQGLELLDKPFQGPVIDMGCSVGRSTFELARHCDTPVLGIDINFSMLRLAQRVLQKGVVRYPQRRIGVVYDRKEFDVEFKAAGQVDFWVCDAQALPFPANSFGLAVGLQVLDSVPSPVGLLESIGKLLRAGGCVILTTPYDWSYQVTALENWLGGHSQRGPNRGAAETVLRILLTPGAHPQSIKGLRLSKELLDIPWHTRIQDRSTMSYSVHLVIAEAYEP
jgi:SAM-dependent methyltransferase/uncharacterized protein YbaR (Trm112 family)